MLDEDAQLGMLFLQFDRLNAFSKAASLDSNISMRLDMLSPRADLKSDGGREQECV